MTIEELNELTPEDADEALLSCCGSTAWSKAVAGRRPFDDLAALLEAADEEWSKLGRDDWLEAFAAHPKIGDMTSLKSRFSHTRSWANEEQAGASSASETVLALLSQGNKKYKKRFGYIFVVSAAEKSAAQMLRILKERLNNDPEAELEVAAAEQQKITELRLQKLIDRDTADA
ncbi:MAG: 2-oxo-4-hydroxy-4-carboxy-5-ureidoimidazoline decarboxylase [Rhodothermales bacterium]|nr:2-oxo-4-hydroxy-4-carboxy-5-ureidoimidazoline decarboxylase [Rhodothermales bacterium]